VSRENVELFKRGVDAFKHGEWRTAGALMDPDILIRADARWPEQRMYGREAAVAWYRELWESVGRDIGMDIEEAIDLGDRVLARLRVHMRGSQSGVEGDLRYSVISTYRDGRVILQEFFLDDAQALKAMGMKE